MKLENSRLIQAEPKAVWDSLVSVDVLQQCIPGCQSMDQTGENEYALTMKTKVGPVSATFKGELALRDIVEGESYTLEFNGSGGAAGFSKGSAAVRLEPTGDATNLHYTVDAKIGGKIAQIGQRLVDGAARKMADDFFSRFEEVVAPRGKSEEASQDAVEAATEPRSAGRGNWLWIGAGIVAVLAIAWFWAAG